MQNLLPLYRSRPMGLDLLWGRLNSEIVGWCLKSTDCHPRGPLRFCYLFIILARWVSTCFGIGRLDSEIVGWLFRTTNCHLRGSLIFCYLFIILAQQVSTCFGIIQRHSDIVGLCFRGIKLPPSRVTPNLFILYHAHTMGLNFL